MKKRFLSLFNKSATPEEAVYSVIVSKARQPVLYSQYGVPDTAAGRTDAIMLHAFLVVDRLYEQSDAAEAFSIRLFKVMYDDLEYGFETIGLSSKKVKSVPDVFNAVCDIYRSAFVADDSERKAAIGKALVTNGLADNEDAAETGRLVEYLEETRHVIADQTVEAILAGKLIFNIQVESK